jgi:aminopeptidase N
MAPTTTAVGFAEVEGIGDSYFPTLGNPGYDVANYHLDLTFDPATGTLTSLVTIAAAATSDLARFNLDFIGFEITELTVDAAPALWDRTTEELTVEPPAPIAAGEDFVVTVAYHGKPVATTSSAIPLNVGWSTVNGQSYVVAEPDAARTWFPCNDHPADKASFTFRITVPDGTTAAANGEHIETVTDVGASTWVWELDELMAPYLATVVIGDFSIVPDDSGPDIGGVAIRNVLPPDLAAAPPGALDQQAEMIEFFSERFGPYPFDEYGIAIVDGFPAALENQTLSVFGRGFAESPDFEIVLVHELAHQWFGDVVSLAQWKDIWLNEGFASYAEWLWIEAQFGEEALALGIEQERQAFAAFGLPPPGSPPAGDLFNGSVYRVGAMTLHALRLTVGDENFFDILRSYVDRFAGGVASTDDFIGVASEVSGEDMRPLFEAWLYGDEIPAFPTP